MHCTYPKRGVTLPVFIFLTHNKRKQNSHVLRYEYKCQAITFIFLAKNLWSIFKLWAYSPHARTSQHKYFLCIFIWQATLRMIVLEEFWKVRTPDVLLKQYLFLIRGYCEMLFSKDTGMTVCICKLEKRTIMSYISSTWLTFW